MSSNLLAKENNGRRKPGLFRKRRLEILAEPIEITHSGSLSITIDAAEGLTMGIFAGEWHRFYPADT